MILLLVGCGVGLLLLVRASDYFVVGSARLATRLRVSPVFIGVAVIGFGTSAPELLVSGLAAAQGSTELAIGNVVGSNVANMTLVLGVAGLLAVVPVRSAVLAAAARQAESFAAQTRGLDAGALQALTRHAGSFNALAMQPGALQAVASHPAAFAALSRHPDALAAIRLTLTSTRRSDDTSLLMNAKPRRSRSRNSGVTRMPS